jgi:hypothetical protein
MTRDCADLTKRPKSVDSRSSPRRNPVTQARRVVTGHEQHQVCSRSDHRILPTAMTACCCAVGIQNHRPILSRAKPGFELHIARSLDIRLVTRWSSRRMPPGSFRAETVSSVKTACGGITVPSSGWSLGWW